jgi:hypothetical protein
VQAYAHAIESRDVAAVRRAYPGMTPAQQRGWEQFFDYARTLRVSYAVSGVDANGATAEVRVTGAYDFTTAAGKRERQPVSFSATVRHDGSAWRLVAVR